MKALLLIDIQKGLTKRDLFEKERFIRTVNQAIEKYRRNGDRIIFFQHENKQLVKGRTDWEIDERISVQKTDWVFSKTQADAFSNPELTDSLKEKGITDVLVGGLVSHGCVSYTCKGGLAKDFCVSLLKGGHTCWNADAEKKVEETENKLTALGVDIYDIDQK